jgi:predicted nucleic acid-binding protein
MPGSAPTRSYWDACVFLAWINKEPERVGVIDALLESATAGTIEIVTSIFSITEVAFAASEKVAKAVSAAELARIDKLWASPSPVKLAEFHRLIATDARDLMRKATGDGLSLKPPDAIHLSTARRLSCDEFLTYDPALFKFGPLIGITASAPFSGTLAFEVDNNGPQDSE